MQPVCAVESLLHTCAATLDFVFPELLLLCSVVVLLFNAFLPEVHFALEPAASGFTGITHPVQPAVVAHLHRKEKASIRKL